MSTSRNKDQVQEKKVKLNKETLKDLEPNDTKVKGGRKGGDTAPISGTCVTLCKGNCN